MTTFAPQPMTPELSKQLEAEGYALPARWPHPARVTTSISGKTGWKVVHPGSLKRDARGRQALDTRRLDPEYVAPDGTRLVKVHNGKRPVLVALSKTLSPSVLALAERQRRPSWAEGCKGEAPEHLKPHLLRKGERLMKGEKRAPVLVPAGGGAEPEHPRECDGIHPHAEVELEAALVAWNGARAKLAETEAAGQVRSLPPRRAILTQKFMALRTEWALAHAEGAVGNQEARFHAWLVARVGSGIALPEPRRSLPRRCQPGAQRAARPTRETRESIMASGRIKIVATPKQLNRRGKWWRTGFVTSMTKVAAREGMRDGLPRWLAPICVKDMTPEQRDRELTRLARRLPNMGDDYTREELSA